MQSHRTCFFVDMYEAFSEMYTQEQNCRAIGYKYLNFTQNICLTLPNNKIPTAVHEAIHPPTSAQELIFSNLLLFASQVGYKVVPHSSVHFRAFLTF